MSYCACIEPPLEIITQIIGLQGPAGSAGGSGHEFFQLVPASVWTINHNLGRYVNVGLFSVGGQKIVGEVVNSSINQTLVYFDAPVAGLALY